ncbi:ABC transporter substrate-binding protein [Thiomicrorhabdus sp. zzn3]|uniref:ABC transporter substrate-binding protein n=1 Tax=Thiomicrorhabdus sp. zzn3 TaxID=3039775 RepID=UPI00243676D7|nr:ABC transporter substrate-binding protein [Thiomicrorhabdus sp. zzn3]MDG6778957.1 ABC transporter substrate-binding protein [Thiomicrorhabdus sp. zzn3]
MTIRSAFILFFVHLIPLWLLSGQTVAQTSPLTQVRLQMKWDHQFQFAGYYMAQAKGFYQQQGIATQFISAKPNQDPVTNVLNGNAEFGIGNSELMIRYHQGDPVKVLGVILQHSPLALVSLKDSGIDQVEKLTNRTVMMEQGASELLAYLMRKGVKSERIHTVPHSFHTTELTNKTVDAMSIYTTTELYELEQKKLNYYIFSPRNAGIDFYGDNLFTTERIIQNHPDLATRFAQASFEGWQYAMNHIEETVDHILKNYPTSRDRQALLYEASSMRDLMRSNLIKPGYMTFERWQHIQAAYQEQGLIPEDLNRSLNDFLYQPNPEEPESSSYLTIIILGLITVIAVLVAIRGYIFLQRASRARKQLYAMLDHSPIPVMLIDEQYRLMQWNHKAEKTFGWHYSEVKFQNALELLIIPTHRIHFRKALENALKTQTGFDLINKVQTRKGDTLSCSWSIAPFQVQSHRYLLCMAIDTSEIRQLKALALAPKKVGNCKKDDKQQFLAGLVEIMQLSLLIWEEEMELSKIQLADQSRLWRVSLDNGTAKTRTLDKYLSLETIPKNPRWKNVIQTANFVIRQCPSHPMTNELKTLKQKYQNL